MSNTTTGDLIAATSHTETTTKASPICSLNDDVLWQIFHLNANMDSDVEFRIHPTDRMINRQSRALFTTWTSSQVCRQWRHLLNNSPALWAQLLDLDGFSTVSIPFRDEVMHRTGSAPLWMYGRVFAQYEWERSFFVATFTKNWPRFRRIRVTVGDSSSIPENTWKVLYEPAEFLEEINLRSTDDLTLSLWENQNINLFSEEAPSLKKFVSWKIKINFGDRLGWMRNIRHLNISYMTSMSVSQWLHMLKQTPHLEHLDLVNAFRTPVDIALKFPMVHLPKLEGISIIHDIRACAVFLDHLVPRNGCYLQLNTPEDTVAPFLDEVLTLTKQVLSRYSECWFNNHFVESFFFSISHKGIRISDYEHYAEDMDESFSTQLTCRRLDDLPNLFCLLDAFSSCNFYNITTLQFEVEIISPEQSLTSEVFQFLLTLPFVEKLKFWKPTTASALVSLNLTRNPLFPRLRTIEIEKSGYFDQTSAKALQEETACFLTWRQEIGHPVEILDLTALKTKAQIKMFDEIVGLTVLCRSVDGDQMEHVCRGTPLAGD